LHKAASAAPNARFGSKTVLTPLKWDVCITPESRHRSAALPIAMSSSATVQRSLKTSTSPRRCSDAREAVKALIVANHFLETDLEKLKAAASMGYARGKLFEETKTLPRDRKDWYD
jgi:hypothetical protein